MNLGGPIDLTPFGSVITGIGLLYWLVAGIALVMAQKKPKTKAGKAAATAIVLIVFGAVPISSMWQAHKAYSQFKESMALFEERCKTAGEKINRTVENVEGVVWMKWRNSKLNRDDQFKLDDPYGSDCGGDYCIAQLLRVTRDADLNPKEAKRHAVGYRFVETVDPKDGMRYRYTGVLKLRPVWTPEAIARLRSSGRDIEAGDHEFTTERVAIEQFTARYGITWDDISTREDREHWIAGGSLKVIDRQTSEVIAERRGYMVDRGQGAGRQGGFRSPWAFAEQNACPLFEPDRDGRRNRRDENRQFVFQALKPSKGE